MPESMRKDVEKSLQDVPLGRKKPERYTRKEGAKLAAETSEQDPAAPSSGHAPKAAMIEHDEVHGVRCALLVGL